MAQDHIHLSSSLGGPPHEGSEGTAPSQTYTAIKRRPSFTVIANPQRSLTGKLFVHILTQSGAPAVFTDFQYRLKVTAAELETLKGELGKTVYLVDHDHPDDAEDHDAYVRTMFFQALSNPEEITNELENYWIDAVFLDKDTVT